MVRSIKEQHHYVIGYVIMPSHVHDIIAFGNTGKTVNSIISNGHRFSAYELIKQLEKRKSNLILQELSSSL